MSRIKVRSFLEGGTVSLLLCLSMLAESSTRMGDPCEVFAKDIIETIMGMDEYISSIINNIGGRAVLSTSDLILFALLALLAFIKVRSRLNDQQTNEIRVVLVEAGSLMIVHSLKKEKNYL